MTPRKGKKIQFGGSIIHVERPILAGIIALIGLVAFLVLISFVWGKVFDKTKVINHATLNDDYTYPFSANDEEMRGEFLKSAYQVERGNLLTPRINNQYYPSIIGKNYKFTVFFPKDAFDNANRVRFNYDQFNMSFYPAIIVPHDSRKALALINNYSKFTNGGSNGSVIYSPQSSNPIQYETVLLGFSNDSDLPDPSAGEYFADVLGTYYWTNRHMDDSFSSSIPELPTILVGEWKNVGFAQITEPTSARLPIPQTVLRNNLRIGLVEAEFATGQTRLKLSVDNSTGAPARWYISPDSTYIVADDQTRKFRQSDRSDSATSGDIGEFTSDRQLSFNELQPRINEGYLVFDGGGIPKKMTIHLTDPVGKGQLTFDVDMSKLVSNETNKEVDK